MVEGMKKGKGRKRGRLRVGKRGRVKGGKGTWVGKGERVKGWKNGKG